MSDAELSQVELLHLTAERLVAEADENGYVDVREGVWLATASAVVNDQLDWGQSDEASGVDFSTSRYWLMDDSGMSPIPVCGPRDKDLLEVVELDEEIVASLERREALTRIAQRTPRNDLASREQAVRGRVM